MKKSIHLYDTLIYITIAILCFIFLTGCQENEPDVPVAPHSTSFSIPTGSNDAFEVITYQSSDIKRWYNDHRAAISITYDTGNPLTPEDQHVYEYVLAHNLTMEIELVSDHYNNHPEFWLELVDHLVPAGINFFGHGHYHVSHDSMTYQEAYNSAKSCMDYMKKMGLNTIAFAYPGGLGIEQETQEAIRNAGFFCGRLSSHRYYFDDYYINPYDSRTNFFALPAIHMEAYDYSNCSSCINTNSELIPILDKALEKRAWIIPMYHAIGQKQSYGWYYMSDFEKDITSIAQRDFWVASMNEIMKYTWERKHASLHIDYYKNATTEKIDNMVIQLQDGLDRHIFDHPLTIQFELPKSWYDEELLLMQENEILQFVQSECKNVMINIIPSAVEYILIPRERMLQKM